MALKDRMPETEALSNWEAILFS